MVLTGPTSTNRLRAPDYGELITKTFQVKTGASYNIAVNHAGSSRTDPEYDYTAQVTYDTTAPVILDDPESILGVKGTAGTFDDTFGALNKTATVHVVKMELKVTHPEASASSAYLNSPGKGTADNLFSTWPDEQFEISANISPKAVAEDLPADYITWQAAGFTVPNNSTNYTFTWSSPGIQEIIVTAENITQSIHVDIPNAGSMTQAEALALVPFIPRGLIGFYGQVAIDYSKTNYSHSATLSDAMRHGMWNALCVSDPLINEENVTKVVTGHEYDNKLSGSWAWGTTMDLKNNEVGRTVVHILPTGSPDQAAIAADLEGKYANGEVWIWKVPSEDNFKEGILINSDGSKIYSSN